jgi:hypothetical protein
MMGGMMEIILEIMMGRMMERILEIMMGNELSPNNMYACPQIDTCHVGIYFGPLVPNFGN